MKKFSTTSNTSALKPLFRSTELETSQFVSKLELNITLPSAADPRPLLASKSRSVTCIQILSAAQQLPSTKQVRTGNILFARVTIRKKTINYQRQFRESAFSLQPSSSQVQVDEQQNAM